MARARAIHWHPVAAYLYLLHLDGPGLAWEYLRRNPDYRLDWHRHGRHAHAQQHPHARRWGLRLLEDPTHDARDALPDWLPEAAASLQLHPDAAAGAEIDADADAYAALPVFQLWGLPGHKRLRQDGSRLRLAVHLPGRDLHMALAPTLGHGMAYAYGVSAAAGSAASGSAGEALRARHRALADALPRLDRHAPEAFALVRARPSADTLLELHTVQALDGTLAGASARELGRVLFSANPAVGAWHTDSGLRAKVRRLIQRGDRLMRGDYRHLVSPHTPKRAS